MSKKITVTIVLRAFDVQHDKIEHVVGVRSVFSASLRRSNVDAMANLIGGGTISQEEEKQAKQHHSQHGVNLHWQAGPQQTHLEQHRALSSIVAKSGKNFHNSHRREPRH